MYRLIGTLCVSFVLCWAAPASLIAADNKNKKLANDPAFAAQDPDFLIQGEYAGQGKGMQVVAAGEGEFDIVIYEGGLPGRGMTQTPPRRLSGDEDVVADLEESLELTRVERVSPTLGAVAPPGATVLFDGTKKSIDQHWKRGRLSGDGLLCEGATTKQAFRDYTLHLEFRTPWMPGFSGQQRGNSGVYHQARYETQVLDSFGTAGRNNETGGIYEVSDPAINACFPPMRWQTYDVDFTAARYDEAGKKVSHARLTVRVNGITVQNDVSVPKPTRASPLKEADSPGPLFLQDHGDPVRFRNIWILPRDAEKEARRPIVAGFERFAQADALNQADAGNLLIGHLSCASCHEGLSSDSLAALGPTQQGPRLTEIAGRVRADALVAMIANPHEAKTGTSMPDPWPGLSSSDREGAAKAIASYLLLRGKGKLEDRQVTAAIAKAGKKLFHEVGCVACHSPRIDDATKIGASVPLGDVHKKYTVPSLVHFLKHATEVRPGLRMPAFTGTNEEAIALAAYLTEEVTVVKGGQMKITRHFIREIGKSCPCLTSSHLSQPRQCMTLI